ncbi:MAG: hypothetical protein R2850_03830 [Bacteroidia bacterium]
MTKVYVDSILNIPGLKAVVLETFGSGNAPTFDWFIEALRKTLFRAGLVIVNVTQCQSGSETFQGKYKTIRFANHWRFKDRILPPKHLPN